MGLIDQFVSGTHSKSKSLRDILESKGEHQNAVIHRMCEELFGVTPEKFKELVLMGSDAPKGQNYCLPEILKLDEEWKRTRDPDWLYDHPLYWLETLCCAWLYTCKTIIQPAVDFLKQENPKLDRIVDWGAGAGLTTIQLAANFPNSTVYYYEISPTSIQMFEWLVDYLELDNIVHIDELPDEEFDAVFFIEVINHIKDPMPAINPVLEKLRVGGIIAQQTSWAFEIKYGESVGHFLEYMIDDYWTDKLRSCTRYLDRALENRGIYRIRSGNLSRSPLWYVRTQPHPEVVPSLAEVLKPAKPLQFAGKTCSLCRTPGHSKKNCPDARLYPVDHYSKPWEIQCPPIWEGNPEDKYVQSFGKVWTKEEIESYIPSTIAGTRLLPTLYEVIDGDNPFKAHQLEINKLLKTINTKKLPDLIDGVLHIYAGGFKLTVENCPHPPEDIGEEEE